MDGGIFWGRRHGNGSPAAADPVSVRTAVRLSVSGNVHVRVATTMSAYEAVSGIALGPPAAPATAGLPWWRTQRP